jgi:hypothetical protein
MTIPRQILLKTRNVSDKNCRSYQNTHFVFSNLFSKVVPFVRYCGKNGITRQATDGDIIWHMRFACWTLRVLTCTQNM